MPEPVLARLCSLLCEEIRAADAAATAAAATDAAATAAAATAALIAALASRRRALCM